MTDHGKEIASRRQQIDEIDDKLLELLAERLRYNAEIGELKATAAGAVFVPSREIEILERLERQNQGRFPAAALRNVFREIFSASRSLQRGLQVSYLGPQGTYTHQAALQQFGNMSDFVPLASIKEIFEEVEAGRTEYGVVPIENSTEGVVTNTLDLLVDSPLTIFAEIHLAIRHELLSQSADITSVKSVHSHSQGLAQCRQWLDLNLPGIPQHTESSTARAAERAAREPGVAAIASSVTAEIYGLEVVCSGVEDQKGNTTRFLVLSRTAPKRSPRDITSILFSTRRDESGTLYRALEPFAQNAVNLTRIESRPTKVRAWEYVFFCDFEGHADDEPVAKAIEELAPRCEFVKVLGSYPRAESL